MWEKPTYGILERSVEVGRGGALRHGEPKREEAERQSAYPLAPSSDWDHCSILRSPGTWVPGALWQRPEGVSLLGWPAAFGHFGVTVGQLALAWVSEGQGAR